MVSPGALHRLPASGPGADSSSLSQEWGLGALGVGSGASGWVWGLQEWGLRAPVVVSGDSGWDLEAPGVAPAAAAEEAAAAPARVPASRRLE